MLLAIRRTSQSSVDATSQWCLKQCATVFILIGSTPSIAFLQPFMFAEIIRGRPKAVYEDLKSSIGACL